MKAKCEYWSNFENRTGGKSYCQCNNEATRDKGDYLRVVGLPYKVRYGCDEHARILGFTEKKDRTICPKCGDKRNKMGYCEKCD